MLEILAQVSQQHALVHQQIPINDSNKTTPAKSFHSRAQELFPSSPESTSSNDNARSIISDSEDELSTQLPISESFRAGLHRLELSFEERKKREGKKFIPETIFVSSDSEDSVITGMSSKGRLERKRKPLRRSNVFLLDSDSDSIKGVTSSISSRSSRAIRRKRRITIEVDGSSSDSDCEIVRKLLVPEEIILPEGVKARAEVEVEECTCTEDVHDDMNDVSNLFTNETEKEDDLIFDEYEEEIDPNYGVLVYEPTPESSRPTQLFVDASPSIKKKVPLPPRKIIDLTVNSDSEKVGDTSLPTSITRKPLHPISTSSSKTPAKTNSFNTPSKLKSNIDKAPIPKSHRKPNSKINSGLLVEEREFLSISLIKELDQKVFRKSWNGLEIVQGKSEPGLPDGIKILWNNRLRNTAGRAKWERTRLPDGTRTNDLSIELSVKVIDTPEKLRLTLSHELVHCAAWIISKEMKPDHGPAFKLWSARIFKVMNIIITTKHSYVISYKFNWKCTNLICGRIFGRHSKSIDVERVGCPCGSRLVPIDSEGNIILPKPKKDDKLVERLVQNFTGINLE